MGQPNNYSTELPLRCLDLLNSLLGVVENDRKTAERHGGALTTTLTLALATPMLMLPIERIQKHLNQAEGYADDRELSPELTKRIDVAVKGKKLADYPKFAEFDWYYLANVAPFNLATGLSSNLTAQLSGDNARSAAAALDFAAFLSCLRNGLSHGGILYLDERGRSSYGQASMICFVSARQEYMRPFCDQRNGRCPPINPAIRDLRLLRISENNFRAFLTNWVGWLQDAGLRNLTAE